MARFLHSVLQQDVTLAAGGSPLRVDLPVNPLSFLLMTIRAQTSTANTLPTLSNLLSVFSSVEILFKGSSIISASLADLARLSVHLWRAPIAREHLNDDANAVTFVTVPVPFGRTPYDPVEAFPASRRGDLVMVQTIASTFTNITSVSVQTEAVELLDATPERFIKATTISKTPTATGDHDVDLPLGNPILGCLLFGTTVPSGSSFNASIGQVKLLIDNVEQYYSQANWETLHNMASLRRVVDWDFEGHTHLENLAAAYTQNVESGPPSDAVRIDNAYAYLDFDPLKDGSYLLQTEGRGRVHLRITADVADAIRVLPVELIAVPTS